MITVIRSSYQKKNNSRIELNEERKNTMTKLFDSALDNVTGGYIRRIRTSGGKRKYLVLDHNTNEVLGTFDTFEEAFDFQTEILMNM